MHDTKSNAICDLLAVSGDTLIGCKWDSGIIITTDGGKSWKEYATPEDFDKITIDNQGTLWGLDKWIGIHEGSHSRLYFSKDLGQHWEGTEFDVDEFFPVEFISATHQNLAIKTYDDKVYKLVGMDLKKDWILLDSLNYEPFTTIYSLPYKIAVDDILKKDSALNRWDTLVTVSEISIPFGLIQSNDSLFIAAGGYGGYKALFASVVNDTSITKYEMESVQALGVIKDSKGRIWTFGDGGIFLFDKNKLKKMY